MGKQGRRKFSADFKEIAVFEALNERSTKEELAKKQKIHPSQITTWKKEILSNARTVFEYSMSGLVWDECGKGEGRALQTDRRSEN